MLKVKDLDVAYGEAQVLHGVNLEVNSGETVFLIGRNGAGKTTCLKTIAGLLNPSSGSIVFEGEEIGGCSPEEAAKKDVRYVFQDKRVFTRLTVRENIELASFGAGVDLSSGIETVLEVYPEMEKFLDIKAKSLSGGQRQLLLIGRALIGNPKLLLIDEPTEGLAAGIMDDVTKILSQLRKEITMLIVEQNVHVTLELASRIYVMSEGRINREALEEDIDNAATLENYL